VILPDKTNKKLIKVYVNDKKAIIKPSISLILFAISPIKRNKTRN